MELKKAVSELFIFDGIDFPAADRKYCITGSCRTEHFTYGEVIFSSAHADSLPVMLSGRAVIKSGDGASGAPLRYLYEGDTFGAATLFGEGGGHTLGISEGECTVGYLPAGTVEKILSAEPACSMNFIRFLSGRIEFLNRKIASFTAGSAEAKLAFYLMGTGETGGKSFTVPVSLSMLSSMLDIGRASLYRAFDRFISEGIIEKDGKNITVTDPALLEKYLK